MNAVERRDWLSAVSESRPKWRLREMNGLLAGLDAAAPGGFWEGGVCGGLGADLVALRYFGEPGAFSKWREAAGNLLEIPRGEEFAPPTDGFPWASLVWNAAAGRAERTALFSRVSAPRGTASSSHWSLTRVAGEKRIRKILFKPDAYSPRTIADAGLSEVLETFGALCPIRDLIYRFSSADSGRRRSLPAWSLRLKEPVPWPRFLRLDLARAFAAEASLQSFLLLDRRVSELVFERETLWAFFRA